MQQAQERLRQAGVEVGVQAQSTRTWKPPEIVIGQQQALPKFAAIAAVTAVAALVAGRFPPPSWGPCVSGWL